MLLRSSGFVSPQAQRGVAIVIALASFVLFASSLNGAYEHMNNDSDKR